jgi:hypothetical protein
VQQCDGKKENAWRRKREKKGNDEKVITIEEKKFKKDEKN